jgi:hypothetical protein
VPVEGRRRAAEGALYEGVLMAPISKAEILRESCCIVAGRNEGGVVVLARRRGVTGLVGVTRSMADGPRSMIVASSVSSPIHSASDAALWAESSA